jgi:hypothetical protein
LTGLMAAAIERRDVARWAGDQGLLIQLPALQS